MRSLRSLNYRKSLNRWSFEDEEFRLSGDLSRKEFVRLLVISLKSALFSEAVKISLADEGDRLMTREEDCLVLGS